MDTPTRKRNLESNIAKEYDKSGIRKAEDGLERETKKAMIGGAIVRKGDIQGTDLGYTATTAEFSKGVRTEASTKEDHTN